MTDICSWMREKNGRRNVAITHIYTHTYTHMYEHTQTFPNEWELIISFAVDCRLAQEQSERKRKTNVLKHKSFQFVV